MHEAAVILPSRPMITLYEALNWLAFQQAVSTDLTLRQSVYEMWGYPPAHQDGGYVLRFAIDEAAGSLSDDDLARLQRFEEPPRDLVFARAKVTSMLTELSLSIEEIREVYRRINDASASRAEKLNEARRTLADNIGAGHLTASGVQMVKVEVMFHHPRPTPITGVPVDIPFNYFRAPNIELSEYGTVAAAPDAGYSDVKFRTADVLAIWPASPPGATNSLSDSTVGASKALSPTDRMETHVTSPEPTPLAKKARGGRPTKFTWQEFNQEVVRFALTTDGFETRLELRQYMLKWCAKSWLDMPDDSTLARKISEICPPELPER